jgi:ATP:corrinoid adenosyltransferase
MSLTTDDINRIANEADLSSSDPRIKQLIKDAYSLGEERERDACSSFYMQLFLDPENQPTQFGTATQEYRDAEKSELLKRLEIAKEVWRKDNELLLVFKEIAHIVRTTHLYGPEMRKLLEKEEAIRERGNQ